MDDYIKRKDAIRAIESLRDCYNGFSDTYDKACIIGVLDEVRKIDVVPIVWCRDCKHGRPQEFHDAFDKPYYQYSCSKLGHLVGAEFYCAFGEGKTDETGER